MSRQRKLLTAKETARICGVSTRTLRNWVSDTQPEPFRRSRRKGRYFFHVDKFLAWLRRNEKHEEAARLNGYLASLREDPPSQPRQDVDESIDEFEQDRRRQQAEAARAAMAGDLGASEGQGEGHSARESSSGRSGAWDIFKVRDNTARMYTQAVRMFVNAPPGEKIPHQKNANAAADLLRKLEIDCIEVAEKMGEVILVADAERLVGGICSKIRHDLMQLPYAAAADLAAMSDHDAIAAFLQQRITDALRHVSDGLRSMEVTSS